MKQLLKFNFGNAKLKSRIAILNLPAGWSCPAALKCFSKTDPATGKVQDGPDIDFRCFGVASERFPGVRALRWHNFNLLKECKDLQETVDLITASLPDCTYIRPHSDSGDFFNETYFLAWLNVAINHPDKVFYTYTKMVHFIVKYKDKIPSNFRLTASYGGRYDSLIVEHGLKSAKVVFSEEAAGTLEIDKDDSHAYSPNVGSFALLLHSHQPKGTPAAEAWKKIMKAGGGYSLKRQGSPTPVVEKGLNQITVSFDK